MNINLTLIGQSIAFIFFAVFCMKYVWPPITGALAERKKKIAEGLEAAERGLQSQEQAQAQVQVQRPGFSILYFPAVDSRWRPRSEPRHSQRRCHFRL